MLDQFLLAMIDTSLILVAVSIVAVLYAANEIGFRIGVWRGRRRTRDERELVGIGAITTGMLGLLAFTLSLTINVAENRFEARRNLVLQDASAIEGAWLRSKLIPAEQAPVITGLIEEFARVQLAYVSSDRFDVEPGLIVRKEALQAQIWRAQQALVAQQPTTATLALGAALIGMFNDSRAERFAFESRIPANMVWMLMGGSVLAIGAMGYHLGAAGSRHVMLTTLLLAMWAGGIVLIADLNRPRIGVIRVDPAPLRWVIQDFEAGH